jgi:hypothetical protein
MNFESPLGLLLFSFLPLFFFTLNTILKKRKSKVASFHILSEIIDSLPRLPSSFLLRKRVQKVLLYASVVLLALSAGGLVLGDSAPEGITGVMVLDHLSGWQDADENGGWEHVRRRADELARRFRADDRLLVLRSDLAEASSGLLPPRRAAAYLASLGESSMPLDLPRVAGELLLLQSLLEPEFMAVVTPLPSRWEKIAEENSLPLVVVPSPSPPAKPNLALLDVEVRPHLLSPTDVSLFCRVGAFASPGSDGPVEAVIQVFSAGTMLFEKDLLLTPGETEGVAIPSLQLSPGVLELRILPEDHFPEDNHFFSHIRSRPFLTVALAKSEHKFLEAALRSLPGLSLLDFDPDDRESHRSAGVIVADGPVGPVDGNLLLIHPSRDYPGFSLSGATSGLSRIESDASHPVLDEVSFGSLHLDRLPVILPSPSLRVVASADGYPLLLLGRNAGGGRLAVIAFDPVSTGWIREASFPILIANLVSWLGEDRGGTGAPGLTAAGKRASSSTRAATGRPFPTGKTKLSSSSICCGRK